MIYCSLLGLPSIFRVDIVHRANPMLWEVFIMSLISVQLRLTMFLNWLSTQLSFLVWWLVFYILIMITLCEELSFYKSTVILYLSFLLSCVVWGANVFSIYMSTPLMYPNSLSCVQALRLYSRFILEYNLIRLYTCFRNLKNKKNIRNRYIQQTNVYFVLWFLVQLFLLCS